LSSALAERRPRHTDWKLPGKIVTGSTHTFTGERVSERPPFTVPIASPPPMTFYGGGPATLLHVLVEESPGKIVTGSTLMVTQERVSNCPSSIIIATASPPPMTFYGGGPATLLHVIDNSSSTAFSVSQIVYQGTDLANVVDPFADFYSYNEPNWDGEDADPISRDTIRAARKFYHVLPAAFGNAHIAPGPDGTISFEWYPKNKKLQKLFIPVGPGDTWQAYWRLGDIAGKIPRASINDSTANKLAALFKSLSD
jgi:hypothetical protein